MDRGIFGIAVVAVLVAALGVGALAYNGNIGSPGADGTYSHDYRQGGRMWGMMNNGGHGPYNGGEGHDDDMPHMMCGDHDEEYDYDNDYGNYSGMTWGGGPMMGGMMMGMMNGEYCYGNMPNMPWLNTTEVNGTIVYVDPNLYIVALQTDDGNLTLKLLRMYVDLENGYMVYGPWLTNTLQVGDQVTVVVPAYANMPVIPILGITVGGDTYMVPPLAG
ncbi:MAG: hypothetical protein F7C35_06000 [Desulfurococcales archaeon]|nr:hypothetical protein [Desulfurococcales archaeon]